MRNIFICILAVSLLLTWQSVHAWNPPSASEQRDAIDGGLHVGTALLSATSGDTVFHAASYDFKTGAESRVTRKKVGSYWFTYDSIRTSQSATWKVHKSIGMNDSTYLDLDSLFVAHAVCSLLVVLNDASVTDSGYFGGYVYGNKGGEFKDSVTTAGLMRVGTNLFVVGRATATDFFATDSGSFVTMDLTGKLTGTNLGVSGWGIFGGSSDTLGKFLTLGGYKAVEIKRGASTDTLYIGLLSDSIKTITTAAIQDSAVDSVKLGRHAVNDSSKISPNIITGDRLVINSIDSTKIADQSINYAMDGDSTSALVAFGVRSTKGADIFGGQLNVSNAAEDTQTTISYSAVKPMSNHSGTLGLSNRIFTAAWVDTVTVGFFLYVRGQRQYPAFVDSFTPATTALLCDVPGAAGSDAVSGSIWEAMPLPTDTTAAGVDILPLTVAWNSAGYVTVKRLPADSTDFSYVKLRCIYRP